MRKSTLLGTLAISAALSTLVPMLNQAEYRDPFVPRPREEPKGADPEDELRKKKRRAQRRARRHSRR